MDTVHSNIFASQWTGPPKRMVQGQLEIIPAIFFFFPSLKWRRQCRALRCGQLAYVVKLFREEWMQLCSELEVPLSERGSLCVGLVQAGKRVVAAGSLSGLSFSLLAWALSPFFRGGF